MGVKIETIETGEDMRLNLFIYGDSGAGKTTLLGTALDCPYTTPILILDIDGGLVSLSGSKVKVVRPRSMTEIQEIYDYLRYDNTKYRAVGIDSTTEMQRKLSMGEILGVLNDDFSYKNLDKHVPADRYDWLSSGEQMRRTIRAFRDLAYLPEKDRRVHVIFTALERFEEKRNTVCPALPGQLGMEIGASVDLLGRLSVEEKHVGEQMKEIRYLSLRRRIDEDGIKYLGKVRVPLGFTFPRGIVNPTMNKLISNWMQREGGDATE